MGEAVKSGIITKCVGGLYTVETPDGILECKARGIFRNKGISLMPVTRLMSATTL